MPTAPTLYEGGRSFNFGDVTSLGIQAVEVYKFTNSRLPSGGIGSTINIVTTKPPFSRWSNKCLECKCCR